MTIYYFLSNTLQSNILQIKYLLDEDLIWRELDTAPSNLSNDNTIVLI